jgi:hypothetical protein
MGAGQLVSVHKYIIWVGGLCILDIICVNTLTHTQLHTPLTPVSSSDPHPEPDAYSLGGSTTSLCLALYLPNRGKLTLNWSKVLFMHFILYVQYFDP